MPFPLIAALPAIGSALGIGGSLYGQSLQNKSIQQQNQASQNFSREMYDRQKTDNLDFWRMQNEYNDPSKQMERLQAAGLNPALLYGNGTASTGTAGPISKADVQKPQFEPNQYGAVQSVASTALASYYDTQIKQAQIDNLKTQNTVQTQDAILKAAQTEETLSRKNRSVFDLDFASELRQTSADALREGVRLQSTQIENLAAQTKQTLSQTELNIAKNASDLKEAVERIATMRLGRTHTRSQMDEIKARINNMAEDTRLKKLTYELQSKGLNWNDPYYVRTLQSEVDSLSKRVSETISSFKSGSDRIKGSAKKFFSIFEPNQRSRKNLYQR